MGPDPLTGWGTPGDTQPRDSGYVGSVVVQSRRGGTAGRGRALLRPLSPLGQLEVSCAPATS